MYDKATGALVITWQLSSQEIEPGSTRSAIANGQLDWTDELVGRQFLFMGSVTCDGDQVPTNNQLQPTLVTIVAGEPPEPPAVAEHASQHQDGGTDQLNVDGLYGELAEGQPPLDHAGQHGQGGTDELSVTGLHGLLADAQTPKTHAATHAPAGTDPIAATAPLAHAASHAPEGSDPIEALTPAPHAATHSPEGGDEIDVTGLPGLLADTQNPTVHGNGAHDPAFATGGDVEGLIELHDAATAAHADSTNLEHVVMKGVENGYAGLDASAKVPLANLPSSHPELETFQPSDYLLYGGRYNSWYHALTLPDDDHGPIVCHCRFGALVVGDAPLNCAIDFHKAGTSVWHAFNRTFDIAAFSSTDSVIFDAEVVFVWNGDTGMYELASSGLLSAPCAAYVSQQYRVSALETSGPEPGDDVEFVLWLRVFDGDTSNCLKVQAVSIDYIVGNLT